MYADKPASATDLESTLDHYRHFLGQVQYFPLEEMARLRLPLLIWQHIFSSAKKRVECGAYIKNPAAYIMDIAQKEKRYVSLACDIKQVREGRRD
ncbi:MAG: hypothetical protein EOO40_00490 [Deltaproteobacteria bacterium]|nr:MAG: hypothetical protein EOO40_00490 [Deltaproteobacteria bacterium]